LVDGKLTVLIDAQHAKIFDKFYDLLLIAFLTNKAGIILRLMFDSYITISIVFKRTQVV